MLNLSTRNIKFWKHRWKRNFSVYSQIDNSISKPPWRLCFFGTDGFSLCSLKVLFKEYKKGEVIKQLGVVTSSSKINVVSQYAEENNLHMHNWPLKSIKEQFDLGIVVSFGHLIPEHIIQMFPLGILNIHASLLPRWRGAAPLIYAIANGDTKTGITIMKIKPKHFDTGEILSQVPLELPRNMMLPELRNKLAEIGAKELIDCLYSLELKLINLLPQSNEGVTYAPRIKSDFAVVDWNKMTAEQIYNRGRALISLYPLTTTWQNIPVKLPVIEELPEYLVKNDHENLNNRAGFVKYHKAYRTLTVKCCDGRYISVKKIGVPKKKIMSASDFNNGYVIKVPVKDRYFK